MSADGGAASSPQPSPARGREKNSSPLTPHKPASQRKMFAFAGPWLDVLENGYILFIDELHDNLHPRSGIAMAMLGLILVAIVFSRHLGGGGSFGLMGRLTILVIGFTLALGLAPVLDRFAWGDMEGDARWRVAGATLDGAGTLLPLGSGPGTYPEVFPVHQPIELGQWFINHAHNDYLEVLYETGVPGWVLMGLFVALFLRQGVRLLGGAEWSRYRCLQVGAGIGLFLLLGHGFTDYNLRVPVNLATFAFLAGLYYPGKTPGFAGGPKKFDNSGSPSRKLRIVSRQAHTCGESRWTNLRA